MTNPLLSNPALPPFRSLKPEHIVPAIAQLIEGADQQLEALLDGGEALTWAGLIELIEEFDDTLGKAWAPVSLLNAVMNSDEIRQAYEEAEQLLTAHITRRGQNKRLYNAYIALKESVEYSSLSQAQQQSIANGIRDFKLAGVALEGENKERYAAIRSELSQLTTKFANNVLDATQGWTCLVVDESTLKGLSAMDIAAAKQRAEQKGKEGYLLTLDMPVYFSVITQAEDESLRKEIYTAFSTRASNQGPFAEADLSQWNNDQIIEDILSLRKELAELLGFSHFSEKSIAPKMAETPQQVLDFLDDLAQKGKPFAETQYQELKQFAKDEFGKEELNAWDGPYYAERLKEARYNVSQEELRPYFPVDQVLSGLFTVANRLYGLRIVENKEQETWHEDVRFFDIYTGETKTASFYLDVFARENKRGGAWMADCRTKRNSQSGPQIPVVFLVCNFNNGVDGGPALLKHDDVVTLFHEFGHGLHHMLTEVNVAAVSGINGVAWDAVELPSQFMENWCWEKEVLEFLSGHFDTGEPLPEEKLNNLLAAKNYNSAMQLVRQLEFSLFDFRLHMEFGTDTFPGVQALLDEVRKKVAVVIPPASNRFQNGFSHIFAGGYAAGYYSYKWAEVLSSDAFSLFEEKGIFDAHTGAKFLSEILQKGGSEDAMTLFENFRGRKPSVEPLLRHCGISE